MKASLIRQTFLDFFQKKEHEIVASSPMVMKDDPTLMFTNAGMNQFKDFFLGNRKSKYSRISDTQKCLRVSGKHNDLDEVGVDTYHHTMFEMLGNWSFGDYFKEEAIDWAYELLVEVYGIDKNNLYVTYFGGDSEDKLQADDETKELWLKYFDKERVLSYGKKDNFWEMGETGPCGPCTEIHIDLRDEEEKKKLPAQELINQSHPQVIELWNLVFIQYNRSKDLSLSDLPNKHVDTGMGFERLAMVLQGKKSNYDSDVFMPLINALEKESGLNYLSSNSKEDVAFRVVVDHVRAVSISIAEGQLPSNTGAGYVIRRILRRAIRYAYSNLNAKEAIIYKLIPPLDQSLGEVFPELRSQIDLVQKVVQEEEESFLNTLDKGIDRFQKYLEINKDINQIDGKFAFELYDTFGFPVDLTGLLASENNISNGVNLIEFQEELSKQKLRSRSATKVDTGDWNVLYKDDIEEFIGYDHTEADVKITRFREVKTQKGTMYQLVFNLTPFYPESGGQIGDTGLLTNEDGKIEILDTKRENNVIIHFAKSLPKNLEANFNAKVDSNKRLKTRKNHSATHLLHHALREVLGKHIEQKGSLVNPKHLRFDFSHFEKVSEEDLKKIENRVNEMIRQGLRLEEKRRVPLAEAKEMGAMALFGEKYGDVVRVVKFGNSIELCGGIHAPNTAEIGQFKIVSEGSISAGIRRIEAITGTAADDFIYNELNTLSEIRSLLKNPKDVVKALESLMKDQQKLQKRLGAVNAQQVDELEKQISNEIKAQTGQKLLLKKVDVGADDIRSLIFKLIRQHSDLVIALAVNTGQKIVVSIGVGEGLIKSGKASAKSLIKEISNDIQGGGGGQDNFATAGGKNASGIEKAFEKIENIVVSN